MHAERSGLTHLVLKPALVRTAAPGLHIENLPCSPQHITEVQHLNFCSLRSNDKVILRPDSSHSVYSNQQYFREGIKGEWFLEVSESQALVLMGDYDLLVPFWNDNAVGYKQPSRFLKVTEYKLDQPCVTNSWFCYSQGRNNWLGR